MKCYLLPALIFCSLHLNAQEKREQEVKINRDQVPAAAVDWLETVFKNVKKVKWYFEENSGKKSYEAKFTNHRINFSVEFSVMGTIEDIELERSMEQLRPTTQKMLQESFSTIPKFKLRRIQEQWTGSPESLSGAVRTQELNEVTIRYEIEYRGIMEGVHAWWEGTFSSDGKLIHYRKIIAPPTDNLDF